MPEKELSEKVAETMVRFDADGSGTLDFTEFSRMLCVEPWVSLLPAEVRSDMDLACNQMRGLKQEKELPLPSSEEVVFLVIQPFSKHMDHVSKKFKPNPIGRHLWHLS